MSTSAVRIQQLRKSYDASFELGPLSFEIPRGAICALVGPNGAGKTTLLNLLMGVGRADVVSPWQHQRQVASQAAHGVQQWAPLMQLAAWPLWAGAMSSFGGPHLMPAWFLTLLLTFAAAFIVASYAVLLASFNQPIPLRRA